jgi:hypothetical protein
MSFVPWMAAARQCIRPLYGIPKYIKWFTNALRKRTFGGYGVVRVIEYRSCDKDNMRDLVLRGGPYTPDEQHSILDYCESDVTALEKLFNQMKFNLDMRMLYKRPLL